MTEIASKYIPVPTRILDNILRKKVTQVGISEDVHKIWKHISYKLYCLNSEDFEAARYSYEGPVALTASKRDSPRILH